MHQNTPSLDIPGLSSLRSGVGIQPHTSRPQFPHMLRRPSRQKDLRMLCKGLAWRSGFWMLCPPPPPTV